MLIAACRLNSKETIELSVNLVKLIDDLIEPEIKLEFAQENNIDSVESAKKFFINFFKKVYFFHFSLLASEIMVTNCNPHPKSASH